MARIVLCPQCRRELTWSSDFPFRPFCSERCKLIDLGVWANEGYRVPVLNELHEDAQSSDEGDAN